MNYKIAWKKEPRLFQDILIILTSVSIFMLATVLESCSYETVDPFSSHDTVPVSNHSVPSSFRSRRTKASISTVTLTPPTSTVRSWPSHEFFQSVLNKPDENIKEIITELPPTQTISSSGTPSPPSIRPTATETNKAIITAVKKPYRHRNQSSISTTPPSITNDTNTTDNEPGEMLRSKMSRDWKLGFDISIVGAETENKTAKNDKDENVHQRDDVRNIPSSVWTKAEIPLRISPYRTKIITQPEYNAANNTNLSRPNLYAKVSGSHNFGEDGKTIWEIRNKTTVHKIKKIPHNDYVDDEKANPYGWIDEIDDITSAPLKKIPQFPKVTWPYNTLKSTTILPFYIYMKGNTTLKITQRPLVLSTTPNIITAPPSSTPIPFSTTFRTTTTTTTAKTPNFEIRPNQVYDDITSWTRIPVLIIEQTTKDKVTTQHWGSSGTTVPSTVAPTRQTFTSKPLRVKAQTYKVKVKKPSRTTTPYTTTTTTPRPPPPAPIENNPAEDFVESLFSVVTDKPVNTQIISTRAPTNIWYKPIINHYSISNLSSPSDVTPSPNTYMNDYFSTEKPVETQGHLEDDFDQNDNLHTDSSLSLPSFLFTTITPTINEASSSGPSGSSLPSFLFPASTPTVNEASYETSALSGSSFPSFLFAPTTPMTTTSESLTAPSKLKYKIKTANSKDKVILFKIWNLQDGKLHLQTEREIPSWILNNYDIQDGTVLNLNELPTQIKDLVKSSIEQSSAKQDKQENRTEREQFHWQELPSASPDGEIISVSSEKSGPVLPSWLTDVSTEWRKPVSLNYVVWNTTSIPNYILKKGSSSEEGISDASSYQQHLQDYLQFITTTKSTIPVPTAASGELHVSQLKNQETLTKLHHVILNFMATTPTPPVKDSHPWDKAEEQDLMANLAAFAIIMTHLRNQYPEHSTKFALPSPPPPNTTPNPYGFTPPARDHFWASMYPLLQHLLNNKDFAFIPPPPPNQKQPSYSQSLNLPTLPPVHRRPAKKPKPTKKRQKVTPTDVTRYNEEDFQTTTITSIIIDNENENEDDDYRSTMEDDDKEETENKNDLTKTLLLSKTKAAVSNIKGKIKDIIKKKKNKWQDFNPSKLGSIQPGKYDISFDVFGGSLYDIVRKKLQALVAMKYMPVFLVLAMGIIPIGIIFIPFLFKYLKFKKIIGGKGKKKGHHHPVYVPVYYPVPQHHHTPHTYSPYAYNPYAHTPGWPAIDTYSAGDNTGYNEEELEQYKGDTEDIHHHYVEPGDVGGVGWHPESVPQPHLLDPDSFKHGETYDEGETPGTKGYSLGLSIGSTLGKLSDALPTISDNKHDTEVLKMLIKNKKDMIKKLLRKWKLTNDKASPYVPPYEETHEDFENLYGRKAGVATRRRRKRYF